MKICQSEATSVFDYRNIDLRQYAPPFTMDPDELRERLEKLRTRHGEMADADNVTADDFVTVDMESDMPKFQKTGITLRVGKGLLNPELEQSLIGMSMGDIKTVSLSEGQVRVKIRGIRRRVMPELTDEVVSSWDIDGVNSVETLLEQIKADAKAAYVEDMAESVTVALSEEVIARSKFVLDLDEVRIVEAEGRRLAEDMLRSAGVDPDTADDDAVRAVSGRTRQEHFEFIREICLSGLKSACLGAGMMESDSAVIEPDDYRKALATCAEGMGISIEEVEKNILPYDKYLRQTAADFHFGRLENYVKEYLTQEEIK